MQDVMHPAARTDEYMIAVETEFSRRIYRRARRPGLFLQNRIDDVNFGEWFLRSYEILVKCAL